MRPIRRFGTSNFVSDRSSIKNHEKFSSVAFSRQSWATTVDDERQKLRGLVFANNYTSPNFDKENRRIEDLSHEAETERPEVIINTPAFQLVCDRRRTASQQRNSNADEPMVTVVSSPEEKSRKGILKKSQNGVVYRSRWASFGRRGVSFADDKGLQLADIHLIDATTPEDPFPNYYGSFSSSARQASGFIADFILPPAYRRLRALQVFDSASPPLASAQIVLESYASSRFAITGIVAVRSTPGVIGAKRVFVRYTNDQWTSSIDNEAVPAQDDGAVKDPMIERYSFTLPFPLRPQTGTRLEFKFGVRMPAGVGGVLSPITYWDDNRGSNYCFTFV